jgi:hypothetical protein
VPYQWTLGGSIDNIDKVNLLKKITNEIKIIHEISDSSSKFCSPQFEASHNALQRAGKIYFLGFGFHEDNIRRFHFFNKDNTSSRVVLSTSLGFSEPMENYMLMRRISKYGFSERIIRHGGTTCELFFKRIGILE